MEILFRPNFSPLCDNILSSKWAVANIDVMWQNRCKDSPLTLKLSLRCDLWSPDICSRKMIFLTLLWLLFGMDIDHFDFQAIYLRTMSSLWQGFSSHAAGASQAQHGRWILNPLIPLIHSLASVHCTVLQIRLCSYFCTQTIQTTHSTDHWTLHKANIPQTDHWTMQTAVQCSLTAKANCWRISAHCTLSEPWLEHCCSTKTSTA